MVNSHGPAVDNYYNERWFSALMGEAVFVKVFFMSFAPADSCTRRTVCVESMVLKDKTKTSSVRPSRPKIILDSIRTSI